MRPTTGGPLNQESLDLLPGKWAFEPKVNGWRGVIHVPSLTVFNRHGQLLSITDEFNDALGYLWETTPPDMEWLDCEMLSRRHDVDKGNIIVLDWINDLLDYEDRRHLLVYHFPCWFPPTMGKNAPATVIPMQEEAMPMWNHLQELNKRIGCDYFEGIVGKRQSSRYEHQLVSPSRTTAHWVKWRFDQYTES